MKKLFSFIKGFTLGLMLILSVAVPLNAILTPTAYAQTPEEVAANAENNNAAQAAEAQARAEGDAEAAKAKSEAFDGSDAITQIAEKTLLLHRLLAPAINFFAFQIGNFLSNDMIFGYSMGEMLKRIWLITRNLVNIFFVFVLLWIALKRIFSSLGGQESGNTIVKDILIMAAFLVAVNFSWLASKVVLDTASVATHVAFAIPMGIGDGIDYVPCEVGTEGTNKGTRGMCMPTSIFYADPGKEQVPNQVEDYFDTEDNRDCDDVREEWYKVYDEETGKPKSTATPEEKEKLAGKTKICWESLNLTKYDQNTAVIYLTYGMARIQNLVRSSAGSLPQLAIGTLFSILIQIAYTVSLLAIFLTMIFRMAALWIFVGFSPILVLFAYLGLPNSFDYSQPANWSIKDFIKWSFAPALIGVVLSVCFLMISAGQGNTKFNPVRVDSIGKIGDFETIFMGIGTLDQLIWLLVVLVVLWMGVFAVIGELPYTKLIKEKIGDFGVTLGTSIARAPLVAPIIPLGSGVSAKPTSIQNILDKFGGDPFGFERDKGSGDPAVLKALDQSAGKLKESPDMREKLVLAGKKGGKGISEISKIAGVSAEHLQDTNTTVLNKWLKEGGIDSEDERRAVIRAIEESKKASAADRAASDAKRKAGVAEENAANKAASESNAQAQGAAGAQGAQGAAGAPGTPAPNPPASPKPPAVGGKSTPPGTAPPPGP